MRETCSSHMKGGVWRHAKAIAGVLVVLSLMGCASNRQPEPPTQDTASFWFIFLERGKPTPPDRTLVANMQQGHLANFRKLHAERKLFAAGPMRDPSGLKRGIVVVKAASADVATRYFDADEYVRDGYMTLNMHAAQPKLALRADVPDASSIEEVRIILVARGSRPRAHDAHLQRLADSGLIGGWYIMSSGPLGDVLFSREKDDAKLRAAMLSAPGLDDAQVQIWPQYLSKDVVR